MSSSHHHLLSYHQQQDTYPSLYDLTDLDNDQQQQVSSSVRVTNQLYSSFTPCMWISAAIYSLFAILYVTCFVLSLVITNYAWEPLLHIFVPHLQQIVVHFAPMLWTVSVTSGIVALFHLSWPFLYLIVHQHCAFLTISLANLGLSVFYTVFSVLLGKMTVQWRDNLSLCHDVEDDEGYLFCKPVMQSITSLFIISICLSLFNIMTIAWHCVTCYRIECHRNGNACTSRLSHDEEVTTPTNTPTGPTAAYDPIE